MHMVMITLAITCLTTTWTLMNLPFVNLKAIVWLLLVDIQREKKKCRDKGDVNGEALLCNDLGDKYIAAELYVEAIGQFKHSLQLMESCNDRLGVATVHRRLSECFQEQGDFDQATEHVKM